MSTTTPLPKNWQSFLCVDKNKEELYHYLSECISSISIPDKEIFTTQNNIVVSAHECQIETRLSPYNHKEADTRIFLHANHCSQNGHRKICIQTVDTDVVVLAIATYHAMSLDELWVAFGVKKTTD